MNKITGATVLTGLLGSPVAHSISPAMHNAAYEFLHLDYVYLAFDVSCENLKTTVDGLKTMHARGFNLTMPHKVAVMEFLDEITPAARLADAVNTVVNENGRLIGYNTDGAGYFSALKESGFLPANKKMTILGAGGAASAIIAQAALDDMKEISVFKRKNASFEKTEHFCERISSETGCIIHVYDMQDAFTLKEEIATSDLLTNATNVGMEPNSKDCLVTKDVLFPKLFVSDIIYHPRKTMLLSLAEEIGCTTQNGLSMLLYQGADAFLLWTGKEMPIFYVKEQLGAEKI